MYQETAQNAREALDLAFQMSNILDTGLDRHTLSVLIALCDFGLNPGALAAVVKELRKEHSSIINSIASSILKLTCMITGRISHGALKFAGNHDKKKKTSLDRPSLTFARRKEGQEEPNNSADKAKRDGRASGVTISQMNGQNCLSRSVHKLHVGKLRIKLCRGRITKAREIYSANMQMCGIRDDSNNATKSLFWQARKACLFVITFETERDRNGAVMLARKYAFDCNVMLAGPDDIV